MVKLSSTQVPEDRSLGSVSGWVGMSVRWLFTDETVGSRALTLNVTTFEPGGAHELHRHPVCEEVLYMLEGSGLHLTESGERAIEGARSPTSRPTSGTGSVTTAISPLGSCAAMGERGASTLRATSCSKGPALSALRSPLPAHGDDGDH